MKLKFEGFIVVVVVVVVVVVADDDDTIEPFLEKKLVIESFGGVIFLENLLIDSFKENL